MILLQVTVGQVQSRDQYWDPGLVPRPGPSLPTRNTFSHIDILANCVHHVLPHIPPLHECDGSNSGIVF